VLTKSGQFDINRLIKEGFLTASPRPHGGRHYVKNIKGDIIDFSTNINPLGPSKTVVSTIRKNLDLISAYPEPDSREFKEAVSDYLQIDEECVVAGNGANEIIHVVADAFVKKGDKVVIPIPTFFEYEFACDKNSATINYVDLDNLVLNVDSVLEAMDKQTKVVFVCNPNNPTGLLTKRDHIQKLLDHAYDNNTLVMIDECFIEFIDEPERNAFVNAVHEYDNLVVLRTLTKAFGLAGLRAGYCIANRKIAQLLNKVKVPWNVNTLAQKAAVAALQDKEHLKKTRHLVKKEKQYLQTQIGKMSKFTPHKSDTNFFLIKLDSIDSLTLKEKLLKKRILVRDCSTFTGMGTDYVRISTRKRRENTLLINALKEV
jgi:threonine-phosphate decarboxylase